MTTWRQCSLPGSTPPASAGSRPAWTTEDLPLPDGPMTPSSGAPTSRATSSATSCSRPKKYGASATSNEASPLNGHTTGASSSPIRRDPLARRLELDDAARQLGLHRAQVGATRRGAPGDRADPPRGLAPGPLARELVHAARARRRSRRAASSSGTSSPRARARTAARSRAPPRGRAARGRPCVGAETPRAPRRPPRRSPARAPGRRRRRAAAAPSSARTSAAAWSASSSDEHRRARAPRGRGPPRRTARVGRARCRRRTAPRRRGGGRRRPARRRSASCRSRAPPAIATIAPAPGPRRSQRSRSAASSASRPDERRARSAGRARAAARRGAGGSSAGSWRRIASCRSRSSGPGSTPISSTSTWRASR